MDSEVVGVVVGSCKSFNMRMFQKATEYVRIGRDFISTGEPDTIDGEIAGGTFVEMVSKAIGRKPTHIVGK